MDSPEFSDSWRTAFAQLGPRMLLFARQWLPSLTDAEDAVQDAFVKFWRKHRQISSDHLGLLFAAVRSAALDQLRRDGRRQRREQTAVAEQRLDSGASSPGVEYDDPLFEFAGGLQAEPGRLQSALLSLPGDQREVVVLKIWGELTFAQIAVALSIPPNTAASRYRYALCGLRKALSPACHE